MLPTTDTTEASVGSGLALHAAAALLLLLHPDHRDAYCMRMGFLQGVGEHALSSHKKDPEKSEDPGVYSM